MGQRASGSIFGPKEKVSQESYDMIHFFLCFFIFFSNCVSEKTKKMFTIKVQMMAMITRLFFSKEIWVKHRAVLFKTIFIFCDKSTQDAVGCHKGLRVKTCLASFKLLGQGYLIGDCTHIHWTDPFCCCSSGW